MQLAGHPGQITFALDTIEKQVSQEELQTYKSLDVIDIKLFVPKLIETKTDSIIIENLLSGTNDSTVRIMDIKLGTSTLTKKGKIKGIEEYRRQKDLQTTSSKLGMCITGYKTPTEYEFKVHKKVNEENLREYLRKVITGPGVERIKSQLREFLDWLVTKNQYEIRGSSLLFVLDDSTSIYRVKLIDLGSFQDIGKPDEGMIIGV